jgi:hypothetical protein
MEQRREREREEREGEREGEMAREERREIEGRAEDVHVRGGRGVGVRARCTRG